MFPVNAILDSLIRSIFYYLGILHLYMRYVFLRRESFPAVIIIYHRFVDRTKDAIDPDPELEHHIKNFRKELKFLKRYFDVVPFDVVVNTLKSDGRFKRPTVAITIDDGRRDNFDILFPVLKEEKIPALIFLTAGLIGTNKKIWVDYLADLFFYTEQKNFRTDDLLGERDYIIDSISAKRIAYNDVLNQLKDMNIEERDAALQFIEKQLGEIKDNEPVMLSWEQVLMMHENNISFGAHSYTHPILTKMPLEDAKNEIRDSKKIIEHKLGVPVRHFAYPNGQPQDFNEDLREYCKEIGFESISTCDVGGNREAADVWALKRIGTFVPLSLFAFHLIRAFSDRRSDEDNNEDMY